MKKLIIALGAVAIATAVNAATVSWGGTFSTPDLSDTLPSGTQFALLYSTSAFSGAATSVEGFTVGSKADNGGSIVSTYAINDEQSGNWEFMAAWDNTGKDVNGYYAVLTLNDAGDKAAYMYLGDISGTTSTSPQQYLVYNAGWASDTMSLTTGGYTAAVAPEPTSGLLILLGMARPRLRFGCVRALREPPTSGGYGLALKRKRA